jgi:hypothetical protein
VLKVEGRSSPSYPANVIAKFGPGPSGAFDDPNVERGGVYTYRVTYASAGTVLATSAPVTVEVPPPEPPPPSLEIHLSGTMSASAMDLKWGSSGAVPDRWQVMRSEGGREYVLHELPGGSAGGYYTDHKVDPQNSYKWRVVGIVGDKAFSSNTVSCP